MMEKAQDKEGYLNPYFMIVDPKGKIMNLRDCHEMCGFLMSIIMPVRPLDLVLTARQRWTPA